MTHKIGYGAKHDEESNSFEWTDLPKKTTNETGAKPEIKNEDLTPILDILFEKFSAASTFEDADNDVFEYTTFYFFSKVKQHYPLEALEPMHIFNYLNERAFKYRSIPGSNDYCWLLKTK